MRAGRRQGGGVEQLHAIAQNHSTIILPVINRQHNTKHTNSTKNIQINIYSGGMLLQF